MNKTINKNSKIIAIYIYIHIYLYIVSVFFLVRSCSSHVCVIVTTVRDVFLGVWHQGRQASEGTNSIRAQMCHRRHNQTLKQGLKAWGGDNSLNFVV